MKARNISLSMAISAIALLTGCGIKSEAPVRESVPSSSYSAPASSVSISEQPAPSLEADTGKIRLAVSEEEPASSSGDSSSVISDAGKISLASAKPSETEPASSSAPASSSKPASSSAPASSSSSKPVSAPVAAPKATEVSGSIASIESVCGLKSTVETSVKACLVDVDRSANPYDVIYDYGKDYDAFVAACDWSKVFDADFYIRSYPLLALLYHNDKALLLKHYQTVGIHEGRQANASFNPGVYASNCDSSISSAFGTDWEGYVFYYLLNYSSEKSVASVSANSKLQQKTIMTALQTDELSHVNAYRKQDGFSALAFDSEMAAFANYRAYINAHDNYHAHDWLHATDYYYVDNLVCPSRNVRCYCENAIECYYLETAPFAPYQNYRVSPGHNKTMIDPDFSIFGASNFYMSRANDFTVQFDTFAG